MYCARCPLPVARCPLPVARCPLRGNYCAASYLVHEAALTGFPVSTDSLDFKVKTIQPRKYF
jgi:hypothetical protein